MAKIERRWQTSTRNGKIRQEMAKVDNSPSLAGTWWWLSAPRPWPPCCHRGWSWWGIYRPCSNRVPRYAGSVLMKRMKWIHYWLICHSHLDGFPHFDRGNPNWKSYWTHVITYLLDERVRSQESVVLLGQLLDQLLVLVHLLQGLLVHGRNSVGWKRDGSKIENLNLSRPQYKWTILPPNHRIILDTRRSVTHRQPHRNVADLRGCKRWTWDAECDGASRYLKTRIRERHRPHVVMAGTDGKV